MASPHAADPLTLRSARVKAARGLARRASRAERRLFLAEGWKAVEAAGSRPGTLVEVFATPAAAREHAALLAEAGAPVSLVEDRAMAALSDAVTPQGLVGVCRLVDRAPDEVVAAFEGLGVLCADVRDPGNAGTVLRTADAAGAGGVVLAGTSVDAYNAKTVRASVGSLFHLPFAQGIAVDEAIALARAVGHQVLAADGAGELDLFESEDRLAAPSVWLFGNEARGLPEDVAGLADHRVRIPILGGAESLNLATAAAVCLYASARARRRR